MTRGGDIGDIQSERLRDRRDVDLGADVRRLRRAELADDTALLPRDAHLDQSRPFAEGEPLERFPGTRDDAFGETTRLVESPQRSLTNGTPTAFGATARPMNPASSTTVST